MSAQSRVAGSSSKSVRQIVIGIAVALGLVVAAGGVVWTVKLVDVPRRVARVAPPCSPFAAKCVFRASQSEQSADIGSLLPTVGDQMRIDLRLSNDAEIANFGTLSAMCASELNTSWVYSLLLRHASS